MQNSTHNSVKNKRIVDYKIRDSLFLPKKTKEREDIQDINVESVNVEGTKVARKKRLVDFDNSFSHNGAKILRI